MTLMAYQLLDYFAGFETFASLPDVTLASTFHHFSASPLRQLQPSDLSEHPRLFSETLMAGQVMQAHICAYRKLPAD